MITVCGLKKYLIFLNAVKFELVLISMVVLIFACIVCLLVPGFKGSNGSKVQDQEIKRFIF